VGKKIRGRTFGSEKSLQIRQNSTNFLGGSQKKKYFFFQEKKFSDSGFELDTCEKIFENF